MKIVFRPRLAIWLVVIGLALCSIGIKWELTRRYSGDVPFWDAWDGIGTQVLQPWRHGTLDMSDAFTRPHNEHRVFWTRAWSLAQAKLIGQWDPLLGPTLNAILHASLAAGLVASLRRYMRGPAWWLIPLACAGLWCGPLDWENTLYEFQLQFYLMIGAAFVHILLCATRPIRSWPWVVGAVAGVFGLGTMSSSFIAPCAVVLVRSLHALQRRRWTVDDTVTVVVCGVLTGVGMASVNVVPGHAFLRSPDVRTFLLALVHAAAYPAHHFLPWLLVLQAPLIWWLVQRARRFRAPWRDAEWIVLGCVAWLCAQIAALALARGNLGYAIASRYADIHGLTLLANATAVGLLWAEVSPRLRRYLAGLALLWTVGAGIGVASQWRTHYDAFLRGMPEKWRRYTAAVRDYAITGNAERLDARPANELPYPNSSAIKKIVSDPLMRSLLPTGIRPPLALQPERTAGFAEAAPAGLPPPDHLAPVWSADGSSKADWQSEPVPTHGLLGVLQIRFAADSRLATRSLRLVTDDGREVPLAIGSFAGDRWQTAHLFIPDDADSVQLVAEAGPDGRWLAFSLPVEMSFGSWLGRQARKAGEPLTVAGAVILLVGLIWGTLQPHQQAPESGAAEEQSGQGSSAAAFPEWMSIGRIWRHKREWILWYGGSALFLALAAAPLARPAAFSTPLFEPGVGRILIRIAMCLSVPGAVILTLRPERMARCTWLVVGLIMVAAALFCEQLRSQFVDKGNYFFGAYPNNGFWQRELQDQVLTLSRDYIPHTYRFLSHSVVAWFQWLSGSFEFGRGLYRTLFDSLLFAVTFRLARVYLSIAFAVASIVVVVMIFPVTNAWHAGQFVDPLSHLSFAVCFYALVRGYEPAIGPSIFTGIFAKESVIVMAAARVFFGRTRLKSVLLTGVYLALGIAAAAAIRLIVNQGEFGYGRISGVNTHHIFANLRVYYEWGPQYLATVGVLLPGAILGWKLMDRPFQWMCALVTVALVVSSALFSWLSEVRNLVPTVALLAIVNMKLAETRLLERSARLGENAQ